MAENNGQPDAGTKPAEGDAGAGTGTPSQKPWWEARGFKSETEAIESYDESRKSMTELQERSSNMEKMVRGLMASQPSAPNVGKPDGEAGYKRYFEGVNLAEAYNDPERYAATILSVADRLSRSVAIQIAEEREALVETRKAFYESNPDLKPFREIVAMVSTDIARENPNMRLADAMTEVATRSRKKIAEIRTGNGAPTLPTNQTGKELPHVGSGGTASDGGPKPASEPKPEMDDIQAAIQDRVKAQQMRAGIRQNKA
jgi:hypothetical protein